MNSRYGFRYSALNWIVVLGLLLQSVALERPISANAQTPPSNFTVEVTNDQVWGDQWSPNGTVTLTIDDSAPYTAPTDEWGHFHLNLGGQFDLYTGQMVTVSDGVTTKTQTVAHLTVTTVDPNVDTVSGTATPGSEVEVDVWGSGPMRVTTAPDGSWLADFGALGVDIALGANGHAQQNDADGDATRVDWQVPHPRIGAWLYEVPGPGLEDYIESDGWPVGVPVTLTIDDPSNGPGVDYTETHIADPSLCCNPPAAVHFDLADVFPLQPGQIIQMSDGLITKELIVTYLAVTDVDLDTDIVYGEGEPGVELSVDIWEDDGIGLVVTVDSRGTWVADYSGLYNVRPGTSIAIHDFDEDRDNTQIGYHIPNPRFNVWPETDYFQAWEWQPNTCLVMSTWYPDLNGPGSTVWMCATDSSGNHETDLTGDLQDIVPGTVLTVTDGIYTKTLTVAPLTVTAVDPDTDTVSGVADPGSEVHVGHVCDENGCAFRRVTADATGNWLADFSIPGEDGDEQNLFDIRPGTGSEARQYDEDGDSSSVSWRALDPTISARLNLNWIAAVDWPVGANVTLSIDDPETPQNPDYTDTQTAQWDPVRTNVMFGLDGVMTLHPGLIVTITDGQFTKEHVIAPVAITAVDKDADILFGKANPDGDVDTGQICDENGCAWRRVLADENGDWIADFSVPGDQPGEESTFDIRPGTGSTMAEFDADGDSTGLDWHVPDPIFNVRSGGNHAWGHDWPLGATLTLTVNDPATPDNPDYTTTSIVEVDQGNPNATYVFFDFGSDFILQPGHLVSVTDGNTTKTHTVIDYAVTGFDTDLDTISGTAAPNSAVDLWICDRWGCVNRHVTVDENGSWLAEFAHPGPQGDGRFDLQPGASGDSSQRDEDGDSTFLDWHIPNTTFGLWLPEDHLNGWDWQPNVSVQVTVDDPGNGPGVDFSTSIPSDASGYIHYEFLSAFDLQPGFMVTVDDGVRKKDHTITNLVATGADADTDTVFGTADPGSTVQVWICWENGCANRHETADANGNWLANFAVPGDQDWEQETFDLQPGTGSDAKQADEDGDVTQVHWHVRNPTFGLWLPEDHLNGWDWPPNAPVEVTVDDPATGPSADFATTLISDEWGNIHYEFGADIDLQPGFVATVSDGVYIKDHVITNLVATSADADTDTVSGTADPGSVVHVWVCGENACANRYETADENGNWVANFGVPGDEPDEQDTFDLVPGYASDANQVDEDGDFTQIHWRVPNPRLGVWPLNDNVQGWEWPAGVTLTLTIDDDDDLSNGVLLTQSTAVDAWGNVNFNVAPFDVQAGQHAALSDGVTTKVHIVTSVAVSVVDADTDIVTGTADPGTMIDVQLWGAGSIQVTADAVGDWSADWTDRFDIVPGTSGAAQQYDVDGDMTQVDWRVPNPRFNAWPLNDVVAGWEWEAGATVTLTIDDGDPNNGILYTTGTIVNEWGDVKFEVGNVLDLQPGHRVTLTDDATTKVHTVTALAVTSVDANLDTVSGTADADTEFDVCIWAWGAPCHRVTADAGGDWSTDFSGEYDLVPGTNGAAMQCDADSNCTQADWRVPNPSFTVWRNSNEVHGYDWPEGALITLVVEDPTTPESPDYTVTQAAAPTDWDSSGRSVQFVLRGHFQLRSGQTVTLTSGLYVRAHTITALTVTGVDAAADTASGTAAPGSDVYVDFKWDSNARRHEVAADDGSWMANFARPGDEPGEEPTFDISPGLELHITQRDDDGDGTAYYWRVPNPRLFVEPNEDNVLGMEWPVDAVVVLEIDDPATPTNPDYTASQIVEPGDWEPRFELQGLFDVQPGHRVTLSDGNITRQHLVTHLAVTNIDIEMDVVAGVANPGAAIHVGTICDERGCAARNVTTDENGNWRADFSVPGSHPGDSGTFDIRPGSGSAAYEGDDEGATKVNWRVPNPRLVASAQYDWISVNEFSSDAPVTLVIYDAPNGNVVFGPQTQTVDWWGNTTFKSEPHDLAPGNVVMVTDETTTEARTLIVDPLSITALDAAYDLAEGTASPFAMVHVNAGDPPITLEAQADGNGQWSADFGAAGLDITVDMGAKVQVFDDDGDETIAEAGGPICVPGTSIGGAVTIASGDAAKQNATVYFEDFATGAQVSATRVQADDTYACRLPDGDYRVWANADGYSREYYDETIFENAARLTVAAGVSHTNVDFTLDTLTAVIDHLVFNFNDPVVSDLAVRRAIAYGTDRARIIAATYLASPLMHSYAPEWHWAQAWDSAPHYDYNPTLAAQILTDAGWVDIDGDGVREKDGVRLHVDYYTTNAALRATVSQIVVENMATIGVEVQVHALEPSQLFGQDGVLERRAFDIAQFAWIWDLNADGASDYPGSIYDSQNVQNFGSYHNPAADQALADAAQFGTRAERLPYYEQHQALVMTDLAMLPLFERREGPLPPHFAVYADESSFPLDDYLAAYNWPEGVPITLTIDDPNTGPGPDYTETGTPVALTGYLADFYPGVTTLARFALADVFDIQPGFVVMLTNGAITRTHTVAALAVSAFSVEADTVTGAADPGSDVTVVITCGPFNEQVCATRHEVAGGAGYWTADFSAPGDEPGEDVYDISALSGSSYAFRADADGDETRVAFAYRTSPPPGFTPTAEVAVTEGDPIRLAVAVDLSGGAQNIGQSAVKAVQMAIEDRGLINGFSVTAQSYDSGCDPATGESAANTVISDTRNVGVIGHTCSGSYMAGLPIYEAAGLVSISGSSTVPTVPGFGPSVFNRTSPDDLVNNSEIWVPALQSQAAVQAWRARYQARFGETPDDYAVLYYDAVQVMLEQIDAVAAVQPDGGLFINRAALASSVRNINYHYGISGCFTFDNQGNRVDLVPGSGACAPNPNFNVWLSWNGVHGYQWPYGATVTLTVDDSGTPQSPDYAGTDVAHTASWDPNSTAVEFNLGGVLDFEPGFVVTMSDGIITKTHTVTSVTITNANLDTDMVYGTAAPDSQVDVEVRDPSGSALRHVTADAAGNWSADFSTSVGPNWEDRAYDLGPGADLSAQQHDADGDGTGFDWRAPNPYIEVSPGSRWAHAREWPNGAVITMTIDDPSNGPGVDFTATATMGQAPWNPGDPNDIVADFDLQGFVVQAGHVITMTDGATNKTLIASSLAVTATDTDADTVSGTATPSAQVQVCASVSNRCITRWVTADGSGNWTANYAIAGVGQDDPDTFDLVPGSNGWAAEYDAEWDRTWADWRVPNPSFAARLSENQVHGYEWPLGVTVTLTIDDPGTPQSPDYTGSQTVSIASWDPRDTWVGFDLTGVLSLHAGQTVTMTDGVTIKTHTITPLAVTAVNVDADTVSGTASPGQGLWVNACGPFSCVDRPAIADGSGNWIVNFAGVFDIRPGSGGEAKQSDDDGDTTQFGWSVPNPRFNAWPLDDVVAGWEWEAGATVTLTIDDDGDPNNGILYTTDTIVDEWGDVKFEVGNVLDLQPGHRATLTDGATTKVHTVTALVVTSVDADLDTVSGTADADAEFDVCIWAWGAPCHRVTADASGDWSTDFSGEYDLVPGTNGAAMQCDVDSDCTQADWQVMEPPTIGAWLAHNEASAYNWPLGASVTLTIDDPATPESPDYTASETSAPAPYDANISLARFELTPAFRQLEAGYEITVTDGVTTKTLTVASLAVTTVDADHDTIAGAASPNAEVNVQIWVGDTPSRHVTADANGNWVADFSVPGDEDFEGNTFDIAPGSYGAATIDEPDGDYTNDFWYLVWTPTGPRPLLIALSADPSLDVPMADFDQLTVLNQLMETLYRYASDGALIPAAATGYTVSPDGLEYTVTLRSDGRWSDGQPVTAQQYVDGLLRVLDPVKGSDYASLFYLIAGAEAYNTGDITDPSLVGITALDAHTLHITLNQPAVYFPQLLAQPIFIPARLDVIAAYGDHWIDAGNFVSNGPYQLVERDGAHLLLELNPYYHSPEQVTFRRVAFVIITSASAQIMAYSQGEVDVVVSVPTDFEQSVWNNPALADDLLITPMLGVNYLGFNTQRAPTDNPLVRQALALAVDRQQLINVALQTPWHTPATGVIPPGVPGYQDGIGFEYDPAQAQALLAQAGYPGGAGLPEIELVAQANRPIRIAIAEEIARQWRDILGIRVRLVTRYWWELQEACGADPGNCSYNGYSLGWIMDYPDANNILNEVFHPDSRLNLTGWDNARYRVLMDLSRVEADPEQRIAYFQEAERILVQDSVAVVPLHYYKRVSLVRPGTYVEFGPLVPYLIRWGASDVDSDGLHDLIDPCPSDPTNTCDPDRSAAAIVGADGGTVATEDGSVTLDIPAGALPDDTSISITDGGTDFVVATNLGRALAVFGVDIQPEGTAFGTPITIVFTWQDANDDGIVDGTHMQERALVISKDGHAITDRCQTDPGCDMAANTFTFQVSSLSLFALVGPLVQADPISQTVDYGDYINSVAITGTDIISGPLHATTTWSLNGGVFTAGLPSGLTLVNNNDCVPSGHLQTCTWTLSGIANVEAGTYVVRIAIADDDTGQTAVDITLLIKPEDARVTFDSGNPVAVKVATPGGNSGAFQLKVDVQEAAESGPLAAPGNINLAQVSVTLEPVGPGSALTVLCTTTGSASAHDYDAVLTVTCNFSSIPVNTYMVKATVAGGYYTGYGEDVLVVYDPSLGFTTGGGWFTWPGTADRTNFGYTMKYNKQRTNIQGSLLLIRHLPDSDEIYRVKSNALYGLALGEDRSVPMGWASFSGKATYLEPDWPEPIGNHAFVVYVEDRNEPGTGVDRFWIEVKDKDGNVVAVMSMNRPATADTVPLQGGNIVVPHSGSGGSGR